MTSLVAESPLEARVRPQAERLALAQTALARAEEIEYALLNVSKDAPEYALSRRELTNAQTARQVAQIDLGVETRALAAAEYTGRQEIVSSRRDQAVKLLLVVDRAAAQLLKATEAFHQHYNETVRMLDGHVSAHLDASPVAMLEAKVTEVRQRLRDSGQL